MAEMALTISFTSWAGPMGLAAVSAPESRLQGKMSCGGGRYNRPLGPRPVRPARRRTRQAAIHYNISLDGASAVRSCALAPSFPFGEEAPSCVALAFAVPRGRGGEIRQMQSVPKKGLGTVHAESTHHTRRASFLGFSGVEIGVRDSDAALARC